LRDAPHWLGVSALLNVAMRCTGMGYTRIEIPCMGTDQARNVAVAEFLKASTNPNDVLVMLDDDHLHPARVVSQLAGHEQGVIGALAFRRGEPYDPIMFVRLPDKRLVSIARWNPGEVLGCDMVGHGAIAIKRWVFDALKRAGHAQPYYRYEYAATCGGNRRSSEDMWFGKVCEDAGIPHYCDTSLIIPHLTQTSIDEVTWGAYIQAHPGGLQEIELEQAQEG
jgi:hypothetical protein